MQYLVTYYVEIDEELMPDKREQLLEAGYWHHKILGGSQRELPDHVLWVQTMPKIERVG